MSIRYRILDASEWSRLDALVESKYIPASESCTAAVAEDEDTGALLGVQFIQLAMHIEPLVLSSPKVNFMRLHEVLLDTVRSNKGLVLYAFSTSPQIDRMAELNGMRKTPYSVFVQEVT